MRRILAALGLVCIASRVDAQAARIGRQPLLDSLSSQRLQCRRLATTPAMRAQGIDSVLSIDDRVHQRLIGVGLDRRDHVRFFNAMIGETSGRRRESESASVFFAEDGRIQRGERRAYTGGTPSRTSEDRSSGLLAGDTLAVRLLARDVIRRCRG